jgi:hypothetical protein
MPKTSISFSPEQIGADAERALSFISQAGNGAEALVDEWVRAGNARAVQAVAAQGEGLARKAARRGLNVLKARGVPLPSEARTGRIATTATSAAREAWLLSPDPSGALGIVLAERQTGGSYQTCFVFFRDGQNILRAQSGQLALSKIKETMQQALGSSGYGPVSVPWAWAQHRVAERRAWHAANKVAEPFGLTALDKLLEGAPAEAPSHPFDEEGLTLADEDAEKLARDSGALHQWPEFRSWLPSDRSVQELLMNLGRRLGPQPPTTKEEVDPIVRELVAAATDRYFTPERRAVLARRMKDSGLSVLARLGETAALQVAAVIHVIRGAGLITNPPSDVRFLTAYFDKAISLLAARQGGQLRIPIPRAARPAPGADSSAEAAEAEAAESAPEESQSEDGPLTEDPLAPDAGPSGAAPAET